MKRVIDSSLIHKSISFKDTSCQIDNSVIGRNVSLGSNVRIFNCVILNSVSISDNVTLNGCFVNSKAFIGSGQSLRDAKIGYQEIIGKSLTAGTSESNDEGQP